MNEESKNIGGIGVKAGKNRQPGRYPKVSRPRCSSCASLVAALLFFIFLVSAPGGAQTLNDAVTLQLRSAGGTPCAVLLNNDGGNIVFLRGELANICSDDGAGDGGGASSDGGGGATPVTLPEIVQKRMEKTDDDEESENGDSDRISSDLSPKDFYESENSGSDTVLEIGRYSIFVSGEYEDLDKDRTDFEDAYDSNIWRLTLGGDVRFSRNIVVGLAFDTYNQDGDFDQSSVVFLDEDGDPVNEPVDSGDFTVNSYRFIAYGSFLPIENLSVQVSANYGITENERERVASFQEDESPSALAAAGVIGSPDADFDADQYGFFVSAGYDISLGAFTLTPRAAYEWQRIDYETHTETGNSGLELKFHEFDITSSLSTLGLAGSFAISTPIGVLVPQASFDWKHQFDLDQQNLDVSFANDTRSKKFVYENEEPDRDYYEVNAGLVFVMANGFQVFGNYRTFTGHSRFDGDAYTLGMRYDF